MSCELKKEWFKELQVLAVSMCLTTLMAFLHIDALSDKLFIYTNLFDLIYCIVGLVNVLRWAFSRDKALAMASKDEKLGVNVRWIAALVAYVLYYAFFPVAVKDWMVM